MAKTKTDEKPAHTGPWQRVRGSISTEEHDDKTWRVFRLGAQAYAGGPVWSQRIEVSAERLAAFPRLYQTVLDTMVRDLTIQVER